MGEHTVGKRVNRREILRLAGTVAAFCTSFGFLQGGQGQLREDQHKSLVPGNSQMRWAQAEIKWYSGTNLLYSSAFPAKVAKHLESNVNATVEVKLFRSGQFLRNLGVIQGKH